MNTITGHNGQGKTSIADAIAFAITGVPFYGGAKLDHLYCQNTRDILVDMEFTDETGAVRRLTRQRVNDNMDILLDGCRITQRDLTVMFMERDLFLSMFNPRYFIDVLGSKGRDLLERYLPEVPHEKIMSALSSHDRELLENQQFLSAEAFAKKLREEISQLDRDMIYNQGKRDLQADQIKERTGQLTEKQQRHAHLTAEADEMEARRTTGFDGSSLNEKLADLYVRHEELLKEPSDGPELTQEVDAQIQAAAQALEQIRGSQFLFDSAQPLPLLWGEQTILQIQFGILNLRVEPVDLLLALRAFILRVLHHAAALLFQCRKRGQASDEPGVHLALQRDENHRRSQGLLQIRL